MSGHDVVIDLGPVEPRLDGPPRPSARAGSRPGSRPGPPTAPRRRQRAVLAAIVAAVLVLAAAAVAVALPGAGPLDPLWTRNRVDQVVVGPETVYLFQLDRADVEAVDLVTGESRWRHTFAAAVLTVAPLGPGLVAVATDGGAVRTQRSYLLDTATGRLLASSPGVMRATVGSPAPLIVSEIDRAIADHHLAGVEPYTGQQLWRVQAAPGQAMVWSPSPGGRAVLFGPEGAYTSYDLISGAVAHEGVVPAAIAPPAALLSPVLIGSRLISVAAGGPMGVVTATVSAFDIDSGRLLWLHASPITSGVTGFVVSGCGDAVCVSDGVAMTGLDPDTGKVRFQVAHGTVTATNTWPEPVVPDTAGPLLIRRDAVTPDSLIVDSHTGRPLLTLTGSDVHVVGRFPGQPGQPGQSGQSGLIVTVTGATGSEPASTQVLIVTASARARLAAVVGGSGVRCQVGGSVLACTDATNHLATWHLPTR